MLAPLLNSISFDSTVWWGSFWAVLVFAVAGWWGTRVVRRENA